MFWFKPRSSELTLSFLLLLVCRKYWVLPTGEKNPFLVLWNYQSFTRDPYFASEIPISRFISWGGVALMLRYLIKDYIEEKEIANWELKIHTLEKRPLQSVPVLWVLHKPNSFKKLIQPWCHIFTGINFFHLKMNNGTTNKAKSLLSCGTLPSPSPIRKGGCEHVLQGFSSCSQGGLIRKSWGSSWSPREISGPGASLPPASWASDEALSFGWRSEEEESLRTQGYKQILPPKKLSLPAHHLFLGPCGKPLVLK